MGTKAFETRRYSTSDRDRSDQTGIWIISRAGNCSRTRTNRWPRLFARPSSQERNRAKGVSVYIFTGPTISAGEAARELKAIYLPPAAEGDVYRAALQRPQAIGIIDGYFQSVPAVRHKEILWTMGRGIHVFGSASMGALRAAELAPFGMEGVGNIFQLYRDGTLEDDDE